MNKAVIIFVLAVIVRDCASFASTESAGDGGESCGLVTDTIVDYALNRFLGNESLRHLPDVNTDRVRLTRMRLEGLDTIRRGCLIKVKNQGGGRLIANVCIRAPLLRVSTAVKIKMAFGISLPEFITITIRDLVIEAEADASLISGGKIKLTNFNIKNVGEINFEDAGILGGFDKIITFFLNTKTMKNKLLIVVETKIIDVIQQNLDNVKL